MSRHEDDLDNGEDLAPRYMAAVNRYAAKARKHDTVYPPLTNRQASYQFQTTEQQNENERFRRS